MTNITNKKHTENIALFINIYDILFTKLMSIGHRDTIGVVELITPAMASLHGKHTVSFTKIQLTLLCFTIYCE